MFKNQDIKEKKAEKEKTIPEPIFNTHKMPKGYKVGRFDYSKNYSESGYMGSSQDNKKHTKKMGFFIIFLGIIIVLFLGYVSFAYIKNPDFSFNKLFSFKNLNISILNNKINFSGKFLVNNGDNMVVSDIQSTNNDNKIDELVAETEDETTTNEIINDINTENSTTSEEIQEINLEQDFYIFLDDDLDGLSNDEEALLGSNKNLKDSDGDGYDDLIEISNLYNPAGTGAIKDNPNINQYKNENFKYSVFYPKNWEINSLSDGSSVIFSINDNSFIQILVEKNDNFMNIKNWYASRFFNLVDNSKIIVNPKWDGVYSDDGLAFYLTDKNFKNVYTVFYSFPENQAGAYINILKMIVSSFNLQ